MVTINVTREILAPLDKVWNIISDVDNDPRYWLGTKSIKNISKNENIIEREVVIAFKQSKCKETVIIDPKKSVRINITDGPIRGTKTIIINPAGINKTKVGVIWDIRLSGLMGMFTTIIKKHIRQGTEESLERIARVVVIG